MTNKKTIGLILLVAGLILLLASLTADAIGVGDGVAFGRNQIAGTAAGVILAGVGFYMRQKT